MTYAVKVIFLDKSHQKCGETSYKGLSRKIFDTYLKKGHAFEYNGEQYKVREPGYAELNPAIVFAIPAGA